jgi:ABC-type antimicrobial peptide transport system permease subunit
VRLSDPQRLEAVLAGLRGDAFSLGWRIFLVVGGLTLLLAVFGVLASAVAQTRWRAYEVAALRVVGLSRSTLVRASVLEHGVMLGCAVLLGLAAAYTSLRLVLPQVELGGTDPLAPEPTYVVHGWILLAGGAGVFLLALLIALGVSRRVVRLGRPSTLRSAEQG